MICRTPFLSLSATETAGWLNGAALSAAAGVKLATGMAAYWPGRRSCRNRGAGSGGRVVGVTRARAYDVPELAHCEKAHQQQNLTASRRNRKSLPSDWASHAGAESEGRQSPRAPLHRVTKPIFMHAMQGCSNLVKAKNEEGLKQCTGEGKPSFPRPWRPALRPQLVAGGLATAVGKPLVCGLTRPGRRRIRVLRRALRPARVAVGRERSNQFLPQPQHVRLALGLFARGVRFVRAV